MTLEDCWAAIAHVLRWDGRRAMFRDDPESLAEVEVVLAEEQAAVRAALRAAYDLGWDAGDGEYEVHKPRIDALGAVEPQERPKEED